MRLDRYFPEQRRRRLGRFDNKLVIIGAVLGIHLFAAAGWTAWAAFHEPDDRPRYVVRYFDIATFPSPAAVAAIMGDTASATPSPAEPAPLRYQVPPVRGNQPD
jgi:hypothetical protein